MKLNGSLMVVGTASGVGKSRITAGLCRVLSDRGVRVAPFKAQNMSLNSFVTVDGLEIAHAQVFQAAAARVDPEIDMNPILLKPTGPSRSQVVVLGRATKEHEAVGYERKKAELFPIVLESYARLRSRYEVIVLEGAGGAAEINLLERDIANLRLARRVGSPAILVGDIDRGGVFAALYGTVALLPEALRGQITGFVINKFRGDASLLDSGIAELEARTSLRCLGVLPYLGDLEIDAEDSLDAPRAPTRRREDAIDVAVIALPHLANHTDFDPLLLEDDVALRMVTRAEELGTPDLIVLPGSKATVGDLEWLRARGLEVAAARAWRRGAVVLGICAGLQMLGNTIVDEVESGRGKVAGLGWLPIDTVFSAEKVTRQVEGRAVDGTAVRGYEIHHGRSDFDICSGEAIAAWLRSTSGEVGGVFNEVAGIYATSWHGLFEEDEFRHAFLAEIATRNTKTYRPAATSYSARRESVITALAEMLVEHLDLEAIYDLMR